MTGYGNLAYLNRLERALKHLERLGIDARRATKPHLASARRLESIGDRGDYPSGYHAKPASRSADPSGYVRFETATGRPTRNASED